MKICFVLPGYPRRPIGGYKVVFEYANKFAEDGFEVTIVFQNNKALEKYKLPEFVKGKIIDYFTKKEPDWFPLNKRIKKYSFRNKKYRSKVLDSDIVVATAATTVDFVKRKFKKSNLYYFIQGFEDWDLTKEELFKTYNLGLKNIVVSKWLQKVVEEKTNVTPIYLRNPLDTSIYKVVNPIENRNVNKIGMLYHSNPTKGSKYALEALKKVKKNIPNLEVIMFGTTDKPANLPKWITYYKNASQEKTVEIYNTVSIFLSATINEGFGLTGLEAMSCGAAFVSTDYLGVHEYAINSKNALLSPIKDTNKLAENVEKLINDSALRYEIATEGIKTGKLFSIDNSFSKFKKLVELG